MLELAPALRGWWYGGKEERRRGGEEERVPGCSVETETARTAGYDRDFAGEGEDGGEIFEGGLSFCFGGHAVL